MNKIIKSLESRTKFIESDLASSSSIWHRSTKINTDDALKKDDARGPELQTPYIARTHRCKMLDLSELNAILYPSA